MERPDIDPARSPDASTSARNASFTGVSDSDQGQGPPPDIGERRRRGWQEFRRAYPGIIATMAFALLAMLAIDGWIIYKRVRYANEVRRLRDGMSTAERNKADMLIATEENKLKVMVELIRRQARGDKTLNLAIAADSGKMYLQREGAILRAMRVELGPEKTVGERPDTVRMAVPRGSRTVEKILTGGGWTVPRWVYQDRGLPVPADRSVGGALGPVAVILNGGTVIYSRPSAGPLSDSAYVMPGSLRARLADLKAIAPNLKPGMAVYFY